ncbi:hypothetical protein OESDEN_05333 [Oesophagostomum dentatum]|uniref:SAM domain-containing protein n=1 Tax=Oesophagostomum dentatum TaxID=61180 RepID=A0A0B1TBV0_OESDE|nr:hypothetical protein OESDEN_05333 [Oesophagostomum dentatum]
MASRCKKRRPESGSGEMSVGEYLALGMDEKGRADSSSCGTDSPDTAGDAPPALDRGDSIDDPSPQPVSDSNKSLETIFVREAMAFRARGGGCGKPLVHYMDAAKEKPNPPKPAKQATPTTVETDNDSKRKLPARTRRSATQNEAQTNKPKKEEPEPEEHADDRKQSSKNRRATPVHHPPRRRTNELELLLSMDFGPKDCGRRILDTEKRKSVLDKEKRLSSETSDHHDKAEHEEKPRSKQKRRSTQSATTESPVKADRSRSSVDSSGTHSHSSKKIRPKFDEEVTPPSSSKGSRSEDSSHSKKPFTTVVDASRTATPAPAPPRGVVSPTSVQPSTVRPPVSSPATNDHSPATDHTVGVVTPVAASSGPLNVPGVDYDIDPKLWTPDVAARWAQAVTGSETCAATFRREEVDGDAMLMMGFDDLRSHLAFTFGPAKKLHLAIEQLKVFREQRYGTP